MHARSYGMVLKKFLMLWIVYIVIIIWNRSVIILSVLYVIYSCHRTFYCRGSTFRFDTLTTRNPIKKMPFPNLATLLVELGSVSDIYEEKIKRFYLFSLKNQIFRLKKVQIVEVRVTRWFLNGQNVTLTLEGILYFW